MGSSAKPNFPSPPQFQADPFLQASQSGLLGIGEALTQGRFLDSSDPTVGFLNQLVTLNPEITQQSIGLASRDVIEARDRAQQDILNQLEATNQLTSSVTGNRLADLNEAFSADIADISTTFRLADAERALANVGGLFTQGLGVLDVVGGRGLSNQELTNQFALERHSREVNLEQERFAREQASDAARSRFFGTLGSVALGPVGGAIGGGITGGFSGANQGFAGGLDLAQTIASFGSPTGGGGGFGGGQLPPAPAGLPGSGDFGLSSRQSLVQQEQLRRFGF